jgi:hypothetical protein
VIGESARWRGAGHRGHRRTSGSCAPSLAALGLCAQSIAAVGF